MYQLRKFWPLRAAGCSSAALLLLLLGPVMGAQLSADPNSPTGQTGLIMVDKKGAKIDFVDPKSHALLESIQVAALNPHEIAISPDHKFAYVTIYGTGVYGANPNPGHSLVVINLLTHKVLHEIDLSPYVAPHGIMVGPDGMLYVTCDAIRKLLIVDPNSQQIVAAIDTEGTGHFLALMPDASKAYVSNKTDRDYVSVVDLKAKAVVRHIPAAGGTEGITVSPDGKRVLVALHARPSLLVIDTADDRIIEEVPLKGLPQISASKDHLLRVRYSPDGATVVAAYFPAGVVSVMPARDLRRQTMLVIGKGLMGMAFTSDSKTVLVSDHDLGRIAVIDLNSPARYLSDFDMGAGVETLAFF